MSDQNAWREVMDAIGDMRLELGPHYAHQALRSPRHLLFTLARYKFAARMFPVGRTIKVLEVGCNEGLGTMMFAEGGNQVLGVDLDAAAIEHANRSLAVHGGVSFVCADIIGAALGDHDAVVSLDVIEHIPPELEDAFLDGLWRHVGAEGFCVVGTPNEAAAAYASEASRIGHVNLFSPERLAAAMGRYFVNVFVFGLNDEVLHTGYFRMSHYILVIGSVPRTSPG